MPHCIVVIVAVAVIGALFAPAPAAASVVIEVAPETHADLGPIRNTLEAALRELGEDVLDAETAAERWQTNTLAAPDIHVDAAYMTQVHTDARGRNRFFESDFEAAVEALAPGLALLTAHPEVLAFHPDLAPASLEAALTLVRAYDALGQPGDAEATLEQVARLMWFANAGETAFPPGFIADFENMKALMGTRAVTLQWHGGEDCRAQVNGFDLTMEPTGGGTRVPVGDHFVRVLCRGRESRVHRIPAGRSAIAVDLNFDDAATLSPRGLELRPRRRTDAALHTLAERGAEAVDEGVAFVIREVVPAREESPQIVEISRVDEGGAVAYRAARVRIEGPTVDARIATVASYLVSGRAESDLRVWNDQHGWAEQVPPLGRRSAAPWIFGGIAIAAGAVGVWSEGRVSESLGDVDACANGLSTQECAGDAMESLRDEARSARRLANAMWIVAGVGAGGAIVSAILNRPAPDVDLAVMPTRAGAFARVRLRF